MGIMANTAFNALLDSDIYLLNRRDICRFEPIATACGNDIYLLAPMPATPYVEEENRLSWTILCYGKEFVEELAAPRGEKPEDDDGSEMAEDNSSVTEDRARTEEVEGEGEEAVLAIIPISVE